MWVSKEPTGDPQLPAHADDAPIPAGEPGGGGDRRTRRSRPMQRAHPAALEFDITYPTTPANLRAVRALLARLGLPAELVLKIIDEAEYYPAMRASLRGSRTLRAIDDCQRPGGSCAARLCLVAPPLPGPAQDETWRVRRVAWDLDGRDQGWGGEAPGTFRGAYSWYEACIIRPLPTADNAPTSAEDGPAADIDGLAQWFAAARKYCAPKDARPDLEAIGYTLVPNGRTDAFVWLVQRNRVAVKQFAHYRVEWAAGQHVDSADAEENGRGTGEGFLETLQPGDRLAMWMRAQYPGWANTVTAPSVEVLYDVY
ncbi:hypothetical protein PYCCODRAFT_1462613 [Trametes coccinea BRFM310]|uniref:Uncharacterized protein n=1 Tax=Trametes coccinea (strain BRFM310) TaxID=1353009 RepID=A0A1Y2J682_TRAC3|nr:hypothetical protein PYCCODRAFT_1462613 [Trametes coccinea BRFM310]